MHLYHEDKISLIKHCATLEAGGKPLIDDDAVMNSVEKMFVAKNDAQVRCRTSAPLLYPTRHFSELFFCVG